jgi:hypothetical protein
VSQRTTFRRNSGTDEMPASTAPNPVKRTTHEPDPPAIDPDEEALEQWADEGGAIAPPPVAHPRP